MLRLALPTIVVLVVQTLVGVTETYFVSSLGTEALAGVALVFPVLMLVQMVKTLTPDQRSRFKALNDRFQQDLQHRPPADPRKPRDH